MRQKIAYTLSSLLVLLCAQMHAATMYPFISNDGQWPEHVRARVELGSSKLWVENNALTWNLIDLSAIAEVHGTGTDVLSLAGQTRVRGHVYKTTFVGAQDGDHHEWDEKQGTKYNFFLGNDPNRWRGNVASYNGITRKNLYPGVDLHLYTDDFVLKYDLLLDAGNDGSAIRMQYDGIDGITLLNDRLIITTSVDQVIEQKPIAWQISADGEKIPIACHYVLIGNEVSFTFEGALDPSLPTVIDPVLIFSTYSGSTSDNFGYTATFDDEGYLYSGSSSFGTGYPVTTGAYQTTWAGGDGQGFLAGTDIALSKYDVSGTFMVWSSYIGGPNDELPHSLIVNDAGELIMMGTSSSPTYPTTADAYSSSFNGGSVIAPSGVGVEYVNGSDIVVTRFTADGSDIIASTFLGGSGNDGVNTASSLKFNYADEFRGEVEIDNEGNIYIASCTYSVDFPVIGGLQANNAGGLDGCITKFSEDLSAVLYSTYIGSAGNEGVYSLAVTSTNKVYACGGTTSASFPTTAGSLSSTYNGGAADGWLMLLQEDGSNYDYATFIGSEVYDQCYFVEVDSDDFPHIYGQTRAPDDTFIINALYGQPNSGMLVMKLDQALSEIIWSTVFGDGDTKPNLSPTAFLVDVCGKIYLSGWGGSTNQNSNLETDNLFGMEVTDDAYQSTTNGSDFYLMVLEDDASALVYASFFGGSVSAEHVDGGTSRFNRKGQIYQSVCAGCGSNDDFPIFPANAVSPTNNSSNCNNGVFKFDFQLPITVADFFIPPLGCINEAIVFQNNSAVSLEFFWDFGDGETSELPTPIHTYAEAGTYEVMLVASHPETCNGVDTLYREIEILEPQTSALDDLQICEGESIQLGPVEDIASFSYFWMPGESLDNPGSAEPFASPADDTNYVLLIDNGACVDTVFQTVFLEDLGVSVSDDIILCGPGETVTLDASSTEPGVEWLWSSNENFTDQLNDGPSDSGIEIFVEEEGTYYVQASIDGCVRIEEVNISFLTAGLDLGPDQVVCAGDTLILTLENELPGFELEWYPENLIISGQGSASVEVIVPAGTTFGLIADDGNGCVANGELYVDVSGLTLDMIDANAAPSDLASGESTMLSVIPSGFDYQWEPSETVQFPNLDETPATPLETTTYYVTIADGECLYFDSVTVRVFDFTCGPPSIYVPNAFTPNGDDQNEKVYVHGNFITDMYFVIYDRWGEKVFETTSINQGWDGTYKGRAVDPAVFVYYLEAVCEDGQSYFEKGNITVIR